MALPPLSSRPRASRWVLGLLAGASLTTAPDAVAYSGGKTFEACTNCHYGGSAPNVGVITHYGGGASVPSGSSIAIRVWVQMTNEPAQSYAGFSMRSTAGGSWGTVLDASGNYVQQLWTGTEWNATHSARKYEDWDNYGNNGYTDFAVLWYPPSGFVGWTELQAWGNAVNGTGSTDGDYANYGSLYVYVSCPDADGDGQTASWCGGGDCNDGNGTIYSGATESCQNQGTDNDCDGDGSELVNSVHYGDGCTTSSPGICAPGFYQCSGANWWDGAYCYSYNAPAAETCQNQGTDNDCDGNAAEIADGINGGASCSTGAQGVCASGTMGCTLGSATCEQSVPAAAESCANTGTDNDCDGNAAELVDGIDGGSSCVTGEPGVCSPGTWQCGAGGHFCQRNVNGSTEICDALDNDCDGATDEGCDDDGDGRCDAGLSLGAGYAAVCPLSASGATGDDCDDARAQSYPGAPELCDGLDNDCDGPSDEDIAQLTCGVGACTAIAQGCVGGVPQNCTPGTPTSETCNGVDDDCDGATDEELGSTTCGVGQCQRTVQNCVTGRPQSCVEGAPAAESCGDVGLDDDCDGDADELEDGLHAGEACTTTQLGACAAGTRACVAGAVACVATRSPVAETCQNQGTDDDCDGDGTEVADGYPAGASCTTGRPGQCGPGIAGCASDGTFECAALAGPVGEACNGLDDDCDGATDEELPALSCGVGACARTAEACLAGVPQVCVEGAPVDELCNDQDDDCDGATDEGCDDDGDDYCDGTMVTTTSTACPAGGGDCADDAAYVFPGAPERCNTLDDDCNGLPDDEIADLDCGVGACRVAAPAGSVCVNGQVLGCTPGTPTTEVCDALDNDCDGLVDEELPRPTCGVGACASVGTSCFYQSCVQGTPGTEVCNGLDDDCNGTTDDGFALARCGVGGCARVGTTCEATSCTPGAPMAEYCNGVDDDCDGLTDEGLPAARCGEGACAAVGTTCAPSSCRPGEPTAEDCNDIDDDCDGEVDDGCDDDGDGWCDGTFAVVTTTACPSGSGDCDDQSADRHPGGQEVCDGVDDDCNGLPDDGTPVPACGQGECRALGTGCQSGAPVGCTPGAPAAETCDGLDNDCDGLIDDGFGDVTCGVGACQVRVAGCIGGVAPTCSPLPAGVELCNLIDDDCDGAVDEGDLCTGGSECWEGECRVLGAGGAAGSAGAGGGAGMGGQPPEPGTGGTLSSGGAAGTSGGAGAAGAAPDGGPVGGAGGAPPAASGEDSGCGCRVAAPTAPRPAAALAVALLALVARGARRRPRA